MQDRALKIAESKDQLVAEAEKELTRKVVRAARVARFDVKK